MKTATSRNAVLLLSGLVVGFVGMGRPAEAQTECMGQLNISYVAGPAFGINGDVHRVRIALGTGSIVGGPLNVACISTVRFFLDCTFSGLPGCTDDGNVMAYAGNISTTCGTAQPDFWTAAVIAGGPAVNYVDFNATGEVMIPANQSAPPGFCQLEFDLQIANSDDARNDTTPNRVEEIVVYAVALCDNGLPTSGSQSGAINLCPACVSDTNECVASGCNQTSGRCSDPVPRDGQPCLGTPDTSGDCAITACLGGVCVADLLPDDTSPGCGPEPRKLSVRRPRRAGGLAGTRSHEGSSQVEIQ